METCSLSGLNLAVICHFRPVGRVGFPIAWKESFRCDYQFAAKFIHPSVIHFIYWFFLEENLDDLDQLMCWV